jgi:hypothetical protein
VRKSSIINNKWRRLSATLAFRAVSFKAVASPARSISMQSCKRLGPKYNRASEPAKLRPSISGMAPKCKLVSLKILNDRGQDLQKDTPKGKVSNILAAIDYVQQVNGYGRRIRISSDVPVARSEGMHPSTTFKIRTILHSWPLAEWIVERTV